MSLFKKKKHELEDDFPKSNSKKNTTKEVDSITEIEGDRLDVNVTGREIDVKKIAVLVIFAVIVISATFAVFYIKFGGKKTEEVGLPVDTAYSEQYQHEAKALDLSKMKSDYSRMGLSEEDYYQEEEKEEIVNTPPPSPQTNVKTNFESQLSNQSSNERSVDSITQRKFGGNILLESGAILTDEKGSKGSSSSSNDDVLARQSGRGDFLTGSSFQDGYVSKTLNRDFLLSSGTNMACVLKTKVVTSYKGIVLCQLSKDVYSDNGKNLLIRAGALVEGTQTTQMMQGNARVFIVWDRIRDRDSIIRIDALGTDTLGASGVPAWVDNHFWQRFGNTILLSFITDAISSAKTHLDKSIDADSVTVDNFANNSSRMAEIALENSINIPPTAYVNQGDKINILVPRNIDFSSVYKNERY